MRRTRSILVALVATTGCLSGEETSEVEEAPLVTPAARVGLVIPGKWIVVLRDDVDDIKIKSVKDKIEKVHGGQVDREYRHALKGFAVGLSDDEADALGANPDVAYIEPDGIVSVVATQANATWGLDRIDQRDLPVDSTYSYTVDGTGVHAFVIDTGIRSTHTDFGGRVQTAAGTYYDAVTAGGTADDCNGHGTHVAGTLGGATWGVAKNVTLHRVRVLDCSGAGSFSGVIAGIDWVTAWKQANPTEPAVANMSLGGGFAQAVNDAVTASSAAGVSYAVAAGNDYGADACGKSPAGTPAAITVGSSTSTDAVSDFSNLGTCVDIFAPGSTITSAWYTGDSATDTISGTSMASPHVAGVAALYLDSNPLATPQEVNAALASTGSGGRLIGDFSTTTNNLVYSLLDPTGGGPVEPPPPPPSTPLENGVPVANLAGAQGSRAHYVLAVPAGTSSLSFSINGGTGDADLYVRFGGQASLSAWDCRPYTAGSNETCSFTAPAVGDWYVMLHGYTAYDGVTLTGSADTPPPAPSFDLTAVGYLVKRTRKVDLSWSGAASARVDVYRNGVKISTTANDGRHTDTIRTGTSPFTYRLCEAGSNVACSDEAVVIF